MNTLEPYLTATRLCDFDTDSSVREKAAEIAQGCAGKRERFERLYRFVKELPYGLEDWDVKASETLGKGWGMCSGKTNLLIAMSRVLSIPARYRVFRIRAEARLLRWAAEQEEGLGAELGELPLEQDHVDCQAFLEGRWQQYDPSRDTSLESGFRALGIPLERVPVADVDGAVRYNILDSMDDWARQRQERRRFRAGRQALFARVNEQLDKIRLLGRGAGAGEVGL
jgi:transglutaminase-like putative cysteine protease